MKIVYYLPCCHFSVTPNSEVRFIVRVCFRFSSWQSKDQNIFETVRTYWSLIDWPELLLALFLKWHAKIWEMSTQGGNSGLPWPLFNCVENRKTWLKCVTGTDPVFYFLLQILFQTVTYQRQSRVARGLSVNDQIW